MALELDPSQRSAALRLDRLRDQLNAGRPSFAARLRARMPWQGAAHPAHLRGIYLWGGVGRGKTLLMDSFYASLQTPQRERTHFYRFMRQVHADLAALKQRSNPLQSVAQGLAAHVRVLCLDEFFVSDIADAMLLSGLLQGLFEQGVTLVATSNVAPQDLYRDGLQRQRFLPAIGLLERHLDVVHVDGGIDYRLRELQQAPTYLDSHAADAPAALARRFAALAGSAAAPCVLTIEGRPIRAQGCVPGMAWFEFRELCEGPRSQNDYIEIAREYHTVFIANVPVFTALNDDAARRFIMLIDEFYDRNVNIVVSAAAAPAALYRGERLRFEFERAASRLMQMQTRQYLAGEHRA